MAAAPAMRRMSLAYKGKGPAGRYGGSGYAPGAGAPMAKKLALPTMKPTGVKKEADIAARVADKLDVGQPFQSKLAPELRGLAEKVAKQGTRGNLTLGKLKVIDGRVEIRVQVAALSDEVLKKLKELGFKELGRAKSVKLLIGTIDVKQLEALAKLPEVRRVTPSL